jgi:osmotically inducible lipoprotein OsmB
MRRLALIGTVVLLAGGLAACGDNRSTRTLTGAAIGGAAGGVAGGLLTGTVVGASVGAAAGAAVGGLVGNATAPKRRGGDED